MLDLSPHIKLNSIERERFNRLRVVVFLVYFLILFLAGYWLLFPNQKLAYFFDNPGSLQNTLIPEFNKDSGIEFDAPYIGDYSDAELEIILDKNASLGSDQLQAFKSYRAFLLPTAQSAGFPDGSLLKNKDSYYVISDGQRRKFQSIDNMMQMGFVSENFLEVSDQEIGMNPPGAAVATEYPDGTLFQIEETFYRISNQQLFPFVSRNAFLSHNRLADAVQQSEGLLDEYEISSEEIGFAAGSLIANSQSVFVISNNVSHPFIGVNVFLSFGYDWGQVTQASNEEVSVYPRGRLFTITSLHPSGTVFFDEHTNKYFRVSENHKQEIIGQNILNYHLLNKRPIVVNTKDMSTAISCKPSKSFSLFKNKYSCELSIEDIGRLKGNSLHFSGLSNSEDEMIQLNLGLKKTLTWNNLKFSLSTLKKRILGENQQ